MECLVLTAPGQALFKSLVINEHVSVMEGVGF